VDISQPGLDIIVAIALLVILVVVALILRAKGRW
jgi:hypothetical protein